MGQEPWARYPALDGTARCFRLHDLVAVRTGQLRPDLPTSIASAAALVDFGAAFGAFTNNKVTNTVGTGENAFGFWFGVHTVQIVGNEVGYQSGTGVAAFLGQGAFNNVVMRNRVLGGGNGIGIRFMTSTPLTQNIATTGNVITDNQRSDD